MNLKNLEAILKKRRPVIERAEGATIPDIFAIYEHLGDCPWHLQVFAEVASTNTLLKQMAAEGAAAGTILIADRQTAGRGRLGRTFLSPGGVGVYLSALIRPNCAPTALMHLTCAVAVAMCDAVENAFGFRPGIKWTNDLVVGNRKLGGILTELGLDPKTGMVDHAILGIGINCGQIETDFDESIRSMATSVRMVTGQNASRERLIAEMVKALEAMDKALLTSPAAILERYRADCITLGQDVSILRGDEVRHGRALNIDAEGGLIVRYDSGETDTVTSGEVSVRGLYGYI